MRDISKYTEVYKKHPFEDVMVKYRRRKVLDVLNKYKAKKILEVGCGEDSIFNCYTDFEYATVVEPSESFAKKAKNDFCNRKNVVIREEMLENFNQIMEFDFILVSSLLHEVEEPEVLLACIKKLCSKNTIVHINVPNSKSFHLLLAHHAKLIDRLGVLTATQKKLMQHTVFDIDRLINMIKRSWGIDDECILEKGSYFIKPFNHAKMKKCLDIGIIDENILDGLYEMVRYFPELGAEIFVNVRVLCK